MSEPIRLDFQPNDRLLARLLGISQVVISYKAATGEADKAVITRSRTDQDDAERAAIREWAAGLTGLPNEHISITP